MPNPLPTLFTRLKNGFRRLRQGIVRLISRFPLGSFLVLLALLIGLVVVGNHFRQPKPEAEAPAPAAVNVHTYEVGGTPTLTVQAKVEKSGVIKLVAQTTGVVQKIKAEEGDHVKRGTPLFSFSTNYQGGSAPALTRSISQKNYQFLVDNFDGQVEMINRSREMANKSADQSKELREIGRKSHDDTKGLISLNEDIQRAVEAQLKEHEANNAPAATIIATKQSLALIQSTLNQLRSGLRASEYTNSDDQEAAHLANLTKDQTLKQLEIQEKTLALNKDLAKLNLKLSQISESLMYPTSPCPGTIERIHVKVGQVVNPGTVLATIRGDANEATAVVLTSQAIAQSISQLEDSYVMIDGQKVAVQPRSVSEEPTDGSLHSILYSLPSNYSSEFANDSYVEMILPVGPGKYMTTVKPYIPLDAVYQGQDQAYVNVAKIQDDGSYKAQSQVVKLGAVTGQYVEVLEGLDEGAKVITDRSVVDGELVTLQ